MRHFERHQQFYNQPIHLTIEQEKDPLTVLKDFFSDYHLHETRDHLSEWLECALTTDNPQFAEYSQRNALFTFAGKLEELIEAAYILSRKAGS